jgi:hypothetical protein
MQKISAQEEDPVSSTIPGNMPLQTNRHARNLSVITKAAINYYDTYLSAALNTPDINIPGRPGTESDISITKYGRSWSAFRMVCKIAYISNKYEG